MRVETDAKRLSLADGGAGVDLADDLGTAEAVLGADETGTVHIFEHTTILYRDDGSAVAVRSLSGTD